MYTHTENN